MLLHYKNLGIVLCVVRRACDTLNPADLQDQRREVFPPGAFLWLPRGAVPRWGALMGRFQAGTVHPDRKSAFCWTRLSPWVRVPILAASPGDGHKRTGRVPRWHDVPGKRVRVRPWRSCPARLPAPCCSVSAPQHLLHDPNRVWGPVTDSGT